jgi:tyrosyl-tRNA synthetase
MFSPYDFYQYWRNVNDADVVRFLKLFTFLPLEEIETYADPAMNINDAKERLAFEQTKIIHGEQEAMKARDAAKSMFGGGLSAEAREGLPSITISMSTLEAGVGAIELFAMTDLCQTNSDARRLIMQGGASIQDRKVEDVKQIIDTSWADNGEMILRAGKKRYFRIVVAS